MSRAVGQVADHHLPVDAKDEARLEDLLLRLRILARQPHHPAGSFRVMLFMRTLLQGCS